MDYERRIIPHLSDVETMRYLIDEGVREEHINNDDIRKMFTFAKKYYNDSKLKFAVSKHILQAEFEEYFTLEGYPSDEEFAIASLIVDKLKKSYRSVQIKEVMRDVSDTLVENPDEALNTLLTRSSLINLQSSTKDRLETYGENIDQRIENYYDRAIANDEGVMVSYPLGWDEVTTETFGIRPRELMFVAGFAGMGKSWCVECIALTAAKAGVRTYLASFENGKEATFDRLDCIHTGIPYREWERGELNPDQLKRMKESREEIREIKELIIDTPRYEEERTLFDIYNRAMYFDTQLFVGDQLSWVHNPKNFKEENPYWKLGDTVRNIADITRAMNMASVWAHQFNRESQKGKNKKGMLQHMAGSSEIERYADWIFGLSATEDMKMTERRVFSILKARRGRGEVDFMMNWQLSGATDISVDKVGGAEW